MTTATHAPLGLDSTTLAAGTKGRRLGLATMVGSGASSQAGAALGALAFPAIGPVGVVAVRQLVTAAVMFVVDPPRLRALRRSDWAPVLALGLTFGVMNLALYTAVARLGLALAVALEFLGPLAIALLSSHRRSDALGAVMAGVGVVALTNPQPSSDFVGLGIGVAAAALAAAYLLLNRDLGRRLPGLQGTSVASLVSAVVWAPIAIGWLLLHPASPQVLGLAVACGVLSSAVPYIAHLSALRRLPASVVSTLMSVNPVLAALAGWAILGQSLTTGEWIGIALIVVGNVVVTRRRGQVSG